MRKSGDMAMKARINPESQFDTPMEVVHDDRLTCEDKQQILKSWELDARVLQTAEAENMGGGESGSLSAVREAMRALNGNA